MEMAGIVGNSPTIKDALRACSMVDRCRGIVSDKVNMDDKIDRWSFDAYCFSSGCKPESGMNTWKKSCKKDGAYCTDTDFRQQCSIANRLSCESDPTKVCVSHPITGADTCVDKIDSSNPCYNGGQKIQVDEHHSVYVTQDPPTLMELGLESIVKSNVPCSSTKVTIFKPAYAWNLKTHTLNSSIRTSAQMITG